MAKFAHLVLLLCAITNVANGVTLVNEVYEGITVALSSELSADRCEKLINNIQEKFQQSSTVLKESLGLHFGDILVVVPKKWEYCGSHSISQINGQVTWNRTDFRIGPTHPVFGDQPWTDQFKSCGFPGNFVYLSEGFVMENASVGNIMIHEWAKYRWGVFEEYGIPGDPIFPSHFPSASNKNQPNLCTNRKIDGLESCGADESCRFTFDDQHTKLIRSSVMAVPEISGAKSFCNERIHKNSNPNKHNVLCDGKSTWDIINRHSDFNEMRSGHGVEEALKVRLVRENTESALVIAVENTAETNDATNRLTFIKESVSQFIKYELLDSYKVGFVEFAAISEKIVQLTVLDDAGRDLLMEAVMSVTISKKSNSDLLRAIMVSSEILEESMGIILLITSCPDRINKLKLEQMVSAAKGNRIWIVLYPYEVCPQAEMLFKLVARTGGQIIYIKDEILPAQHPYVSPNIRMRLSQSYRSVLQSESNYHIQQVSKEKCKKTEVWCKRNINVMDNFNQLHYLYFYHDYKEHVFASSKVSVTGDGYCTLINQLSKGTKIFECHINKGSTVSISVERDRPSDILIFELVGSPSRLKSDYDLNIWSSNPLQNLTYSRYGIPAVHVELTYEKRRILNANVTLQIEAENIATDHYSYVNLNDQGVGADITGNDGIYSGYILPIPVDRTIVLSVFADDNDEKAMIWPNEFDSRNKEKVICCGSKISSSRNDRHKKIFTTSLCNVPAVSHISSSYIRIAPSQVRDLVATQDDNEITLTFTAPGHQLDHGTANFYMLSVYENNLEREMYVEKIEVQPKESGSMESFNVEIHNCSTIYGYRVTASDDKLNKAKESNLAIIQPLCKHRRNEGKMSSAKVAGIVVGILLVILLLILFYFWQRRRKRQNKINENASRQANGRLLEEGREPTPSGMTTFSRPIRSIEDLTSELSEESQYVQIPYTETKSKSMDNIEANELVQLVNKRKQSRDTNHDTTGDMSTQRASTSSSPNIIGIPLLLNEAIEYKRNKMEKNNKKPDIARTNELENPYSPSSSDGTEI